MGDDVRAFQSHENSPDDDCKPATVVIAAANRMAAVEALRRSGFGARKVIESNPGSAEAAAAMTEPGIIRWCDWFDKSDDRPWHRV